MDRFRYRPRPVDSIRWPFVLVLCVLCLAGCGDSGSSGQPAAGSGGTGAIAGAGGFGGSGGSAGGAGGSAGRPLCAGVDCDDGNACTEDDCNPANGLCEYVHVDNGTSCELAGLPGLCGDGRCEDAALCAGVDCDDGNECTEDGCNPLDGLCEYVQVDNGTSCQLGGLPGLCGDGNCEDAALCAGVDCDDGNACTEDGCNPLNGLCEHTNLTNQATCDFAGFPGVCRAGTCEDALLCAGVDCDDGNECTTEACNREDGLCDYANVPDETRCNFAGFPGVCRAGTCEDALLCAGVDCDDGNPCTSGVCDPFSGQCDFTPVLQPVPCDFRGGPGVCDDGLCIDAGLCDDALSRCEDGNECTVDQCDPASGRCSSSSQQADGASCGAGAGSCVSGKCEIQAQTKSFKTTCTDTLFGYTADIPVDLTVAPTRAYADGASATTFVASFRLDQGLSALLVGLGIDSTEITALEVNVGASGGSPATVDLPSAEALPVVVDFSTTEAVNTSTVLQTVTPDGVSSTVDFSVVDWSLGIRIDNMGVPINTRLSPGESGPIFDCGPLLSVEGSVRYPQ